MKKINKNNIHKNTRFKKACALVLAAAMVSMTAVTGSVSGVFAKDPDADALCGIPAHTHGSECYETHKELACGQEEGSVHTHSADCYETETSLICDEPESEGHKHTDDCYTVTEELTCGEEESDEHTHTSDCYTERRELTCGQEESEGHTHTDACYEEHEKLVCGLEEGVPHQHTDACYKETKELVCGIQEHVHTDACYAENEKDWKKMAAELDFNGNWAHDFVMTAESQLDYDASSVIYITDEDGNKKGYTRYGDWYSDDESEIYGKWDATFVSFCLNYAGVKGVPFGFDCQEWLEMIKKQDEDNAKAAAGSENEAAISPQAAENEEIAAVTAPGAEEAAQSTAASQLYYDRADYTPVAGDIVFFGADDTATHVGIITDIDGARITTIEGGRGPVAYHEYTLNEDGTLEEDERTAAQDAPAAAQSAETDADTIADPNADANADAESADAASDSLGNSAILGYVKLPANPDEDEWKIKNAENFENLVTITDTSGNVSVAGDFPEGVTVTAEPLTGKELKELDIDKKFVVFAYDITLWLDGEVYEPEKPVSVKVIPKAKPENDVILTHIKTDETGEVTERFTVQNSVDESGSVIFDASGFSIYVATQAQEVVLNLENATISELIDLDTALLKWKATKDTESISEAKITVSGTEYTISDETYDGLYKQVYYAMLKEAGGSGSSAAGSESETESSTGSSDSTAGESTANNNSADAGENTDADTPETSDNTGTAQTLNGSINATTISQDTIWNVPSGTTVTMNGNITVNSGARLVILGEGNISRSGNYVITSSGVVCLQGSVIADGGGDTYDGRFITLSGNNSNSSSKSELYIADDFKIQNYSVVGQKGAGIFGQSACVYMSGGIIGSEDITFTWNDGKTTQYGTDTESYLLGRESKGEYPYLIKITSSKGCKGRGNEVSNSPKGGGVALEDSEFYMSGGGIIGNMLIGECEIDDPNTNGKGSHGAGADFYKCNVYITGGKVSGNQSAVKDGCEKLYNQYSGAIQLEGTQGNYNCILSNTEISYNFAQMWVGAIDIYSGNTLYLNRGTVVKYNHANSNSGAIAVDGTGASMVMEDGSKVTRNHSGNLGGGIRCLGTLTMNGGEISYNSSRGNAAGLSIQTDKDRSGKAELNGGSINNNYSASNGGGIGIVTGIQDGSSGLTLNGTNVYSNTARLNGGGFYIDADHGTVSAKLESGELRDNTATNGGGIYINQVNECNASLDINSNKMIINKNTATNKMNINDNENINGKGNGGGIYLYHAPNLNGSNGSVSANISGGTISENTAEASGGGLYVNSGDLTISGGTFSKNTAAENGGGAYVADGKIRMFGGTITGNTSAEDGGGICVSSSKQAADVVVRSGTISNNKAGGNASAGTSGSQAAGNGGAIAVISESGTSATEDKVTIGLLEEHKDLYTSKHTFTPFEYTDPLDNEGSASLSSGTDVTGLQSDASSETADDASSGTGNELKRTHSACPVMTGNTAAGDGGGIYMSSSDAKLNIYCLDENNNTSQKNSNGGSIMTNGGTVIIGDASYQGNENETVKGNITLSSPMLISGGNVDIYGKMDNPYFEGNILVDIKNNSGKFVDHRTTTSKGDSEGTTVQEYYKIHYFENFKAEGETSASGSYKALQYKSSATIKVEGALFSHPGYMLTGWSTTKDDSEESGTVYNIGDTIATGSDHNAWSSEKPNDPLILYAVWKPITYTVKFDPNATGYIGEMEDQTVTYGKTQVLTQNAFTVTGKNFTGWNTKADGQGTQYEANYNESKMTTTNGDKITLYAQWSDCTHNGSGGHNLKYTLSEDGRTITERCSCGGHEASVTLSAYSAYMDGKAHEATLTRKGTLNCETENNSIEIKYYESKSVTDAKDYTPMTNDQKPEKVGYYKAEITVNDLTAFVEYEIKSAVQDTALEGSIEVGEVFDDTFKGAESVNIDGKGAFTAEFKLYKLKKDVITIAPTLTVSNLPSDSTIIMYTDSKYYYLKSKESETDFAITNFKSMGGSDNFNYVASEEQTYRFIVNCSQVSTSLKSGNATLAYSSNNNAEQVKKNVSFTCKTESFNLEKAEAENNITVSAPADIPSNKQMVLVLSSVDGSNVPSDASLTVISGESSTVKTGVYKLNQDKEFIIPLTWSISQTLNLSLSSEAAASAGKPFNFTAELFVGNKAYMDSAIINTELISAKAGSAKASLDNMSLTVPTDNSPAIKLANESGASRLLTKNDTLKLNVQMSDNISQYNVSSVIEQKGQNGYTGNFGALNLNENTSGGNSNVRSFALSGISDAGSYRLLVTVSKKNTNGSSGEKLLEVPYYFIITS